MSIPPRTTAALVSGVLVDNYNCTTDLTPFIAAASAVVDNVVCLGKKYCRGCLSFTSQQQVETWLAAHFYCINDPLYNGKTTAGASGQFQRGKRTGLYETTDYGAAAVAMDWTGVMNALSNRLFAHAFHIPECPPVCGPCTPEINCGTGTGPTGLMYGPNPNCPNCGCSSGCGC